ncbi:MAG: hypothetical protein ACREEM_01560 [Blastocatellia bacterium]
MTIPFIQTALPYPAISGSGIVSTFGWSNYHSLQTSVTRSFGGGLQFNANYVWSKALGLESSEAQSNGFADGGFGYNAGSLDLRNLRENYGLLSTDVPHRFIASFVYEPPLGKGKMFDAGKALNAVIGGWRVGGVYSLQSGTPVFVSGASSGAINGKGHRVPGVALELPKALQRWYDSPNTADRTVTLPSGRRITVCRYCFLKYNPDAFRGAIVQAPNGTIIVDQYWYGTSALSFGDICQPRLNNFNFSVDRAFAITERLRFEFSMQATNFLNHTQFRPTVNGNVGGTNTSTANDGIPGLGNNDNYGTRSTATFDPRQIEFQLRLRF